MLYDGRWKVSVIGTTVGSYRVMQRLGQGGVGSVYRVEHAVLGTAHALKVLTMPNERARQRLLAEGRIQAQLQHEHLVAVRDVVDVAGQPGLVMDLVNGPTLARLLAEGPLPVVGIARLADGILQGMARAHEVRLVHRDLKPANVLLEVTDDDLVAKVADFGLAREGGGVGATATGASLGTPRYMAPEQVRDPRDVDARSDVWALGVVLYELCSGRPPFDQNDLLELYSDIAAARCVPLAEARPGLPEAWYAAVGAALRVDRADRPADAAELLALWGTEVVGEVPEALLATARSVAPVLRDDPASQATWSGEGTFDSAAAASTPSAPKVRLADPVEDPLEGFTDHRPPAPLPPPSQHRELPAPSRAPWILVGALTVALGGTLLLWVGSPGPQAPSVVAVPTTPPPEEPATTWPAQAFSERAYQSFLDGDFFEARKQADMVVAAAPVEQPQLVILASAACLDQRSSAWEELERGAYFGLPPVREALRLALGDPEAFDEALMETEDPTAIVARITMGPHHPERDAELLAALGEGVGRRRILPLVEARAAMARGELDVARAAFDRAAAGTDVPEPVRAYDALWFVHAGDLEEAARRIDAVVADVEKPSSTTWLVRNVVDERLERTVLAAESKQRFHAPVTVSAGLSLMAVDQHFETGDVEGGFEGYRAVLTGLQRYHRSKEVNAVRVDLVTEMVRLGGLAGERDVVVDGLSRLRAFEDLSMPSSRDGVAAMRAALAEAVLEELEGRGGALDELRVQLEGQPITRHVELDVLRDVRQGAPLRVHLRVLP